MENNEQRCAVSIDIETLGLAPWAPIIQIGAAVFSIDDEPGEVIDTLEFYVWQEAFDNVEPYAAAMNAEILYAIASVKEEDFPDDDGEPCIRFSGEKYPGTYVRDIDAIDFLNTWIERHEAQFVGGKFTLCGKNFGSFDKPMLDRLGDLVTSRHRYPDPGSLFWQPEIDGTVLPDTKTCMQRVGITGAVEHTAKADAIVVARLIQTWVQDQGP